MATDKEILYNMITRTVSNMLQPYPLFRLVSDNVANLLIDYIDPYVDAFMHQDHLMTREATTYLSREVADKIQKFKADFEQERQNEENE